MKRKINILFFIALISMLLIPLMLTDIKGTVSAADGRNLVEKPLLADDSFCKDAESWLKDRLGLRDRIADAFVLANDSVFCELINPVYQYGSDRYTFFKVHNNIEYGDYHRRFAEMVTSMQNYCESRGSRFYYVFNPEKESIYRSKLPAGVNYDDSWVDSMLSYMKTLGVNCIDLRDVLEKESDEKNVFDHKNDAGHWNHNGAFYGMQEITRNLHSDMPEVKILDENEYEISKKTVEKLYASNHMINEEVPVYSLKAECTDVTGDLNAELVKDPSYQYFRLKKNSSDKTKGIRRLLLFQDDLYTPFAIARSEETAILTGLQNAINLDYYYNIFKPDAVIFENMEYVVKDKYFSQAAVEAVDYNPAILENYPEDSFWERKDELLWQTEEVYSDTSAVLIPGKSVDKIFLSKDLGKVRYAYLITDDKVIDLKINEHGALIASIKHGDLTEGSYITLYVLKDDGKKCYSIIPVTNKKQNIAVRKEQTPNADHDKDNGRYIMTNSLEGDAFTYNAIHLYNEEINEYLVPIVASTSSGTMDGAYCHMLPTGDYSLLLRAGSRNTSEWTVFKAHLVEGHSYWYTYNVVKFSGKKVIISNFSFSEPVEDIWEN